MAGLTQSQVRYAMDEMRQIKKEKLEKAMEPFNFDEEVLEDEALMALTAAVLNGSWRLQPKEIVEVSRYTYAVNVITCDLYDELLAKKALWKEKNDHFSAQLDQMLDDAEDALVLGDGDAMIAVIETFKNISL